LLRIVQCAWQFSQTALPDDLRLPGPEWQRLLTSLGVEPAELLNLQPVAEIVSASQPGESLWPLMVEVAKEALRAQHFAEAAGRQARSWQHWGQAVQSRFDAELRERQLQSLAVFAAGAGHELGNPLAVISGYAEQLLRTEKQWERIEALQRILAQCRRMDSLIRDLMFYARPPEPKFRHCRLDRLLTQVAKELTPYASSKCVAIHSHCETHQPSLRADKSLLQKALDCLLRNAIEAAPVGGWVRCTLHAEPSHGLSVHIEDNGPGPDPAWQEHIFDPFFSGRSAGRGHGLGLCKVWRIAQLHGGQITWERTPQNTTRFILRLPQRPASKTS
jgi:signal transduction histidine kinase